MSEPSPPTGRPQVILNGVTFDLKVTDEDVTFGGKTYRKLIRTGEITITGTWDPFEQLREDGTQP